MAQGALTYPNNKVCSNSSVVKIAQKIKDHLGFYDLSRALQHGIELQLYFRKLERLPAVKRDAFTVFLDARVLEAERALVLLEVGYARGC